MVIKGGDNSLLPHFLIPTELNESHVDLKVRFFFTLCGPKDGTVARQKKSEFLIQALLFLYYSS